MLLGFVSFGSHASRDEARRPPAPPPRRPRVLSRFASSRHNCVAPVRRCARVMPASMPVRMYRQPNEQNVKYQKSHGSQLCKRDTNYVTSRECVYNCACSPSNILDVGIFANRVLSSSTHGSSSCPISSAALTRAASSPNPQQCLLPEPSGLPIVASSAPSRSLPPPRTSLQRARVAQRCGSSQFFCPFSSAFEACISRSRPPLRNRPP